MRLLVTSTALLLLAACQHSPLVGNDADMSAGDTPCVDGAVDVQTCGNCGSAQRQCVAGAWQPFGACSNEGECAPDATENQTCGSNVGACMPGTATRTCTANCNWSAWSSCGGTYVGPTPEICGDDLDNDCNGLPDDGCPCTPVKPGQGGSLALAGAVTKMASDPDPANCLVYALDVLPQSSTQQLVVVDARAKTVVATIALPHYPSDFDLSPNGQYLVVGYTTQKQISVIDKTHWTIANTINAATYVDQVEVDDNGFVYYGAVSNWEQAHRIALSVGMPSDMLTGTELLTTPEVELSADGTHLYTANTGISQAAVVRHALANGTATKDGATIWGDGFGFTSPYGPMMLSRGGQHLYFAGYQMDAQNLDRVTGAPGERIFAEDVAGTFAVGASSVFDAQLAQNVASLPLTASAATLTAGDREVWYSSQQKLYYQNVADFLAGVPLGVRPRPAAPLASYNFVKLIADPVRPRVYGLDADHQLVVAIDTASGLATGAIVVGSRPTDISVPASGGTLWISHEGVGALGRIDLATWQFSGFVPVPIDSERVAALADSWVATIDLDQFTTPTLLNASTGAVVDSLPHRVYEGALCATSDGKTLFIGESAVSSTQLARYDVTTGKLVKMATSNGSFSYPERAITCASDGSILFYGGSALEGTGLTITYSQPDPILSMTPDARLAISATTVYRASDGTVLGSLPATLSVQAVSPDGQKLYAVGSGALQTVDLTTY